MVLDLRCIRARRFARARPRAGPRGASNLGISSLVPGIGSYWYVSTEIAFGTSDNTCPRKNPPRHTHRLEELTDLKLRRLSCAWP